MNILLLCYEYPPLGGGGGVGASQYAEAWARQKHRVTVLTGRATGLPRRETVNGVEVIRVPSPGRFDRATSSFVSMAFYNLTAVLYALLHRRDLCQRGDVINTHFSIPTGPAATVIAWWLVLPNVLTIIGGDIYDPSKKSSPHRSKLMRRINRTVIGGADHVIAISSDTKKRAIEHYGITRNIQIINYGFMPTPATSEYGPGPRLKTSENYRLISVGRLVPRKGFDHLIRAMRLLPHNVELSIVGDGPMDSLLRQIAAREGVGKRVVFHGYQPRQNIYRMLRQADCYVLPSLHEGLGIVVQEAMEAGLPVIATNSGGQVDLIREPRNGLLVPVGDTKAMADAVMKIYHDPLLAAEMGKHNEQDIAELHVDKNCRLYLEAFERVIAVRHNAAQAPTTD